VKQTMDDFKFFPQTSLIMTMDQKQDLAGWV